MDQELVTLNSMKQLGFSEYESKAYLKLLEAYPLNGYTLSKNSGIPRSRIYEVLQNLIDKQLVFEQEEEKNKLYYPVEPEIFINKIKKRYEDLIADVSAFAERVYREKKQDDRLVVIRGRRNIFEFLNMLIRSAEKRIAISIWEEEIGELVDELEKAIDRGVVLRGIYFGKNRPFDVLVPHRRIERYMAEKKERYVVIIIDGAHTISGVVSRGENSRVTWTRDEGFIEISEDYIAHDLLVNRYSASLTREEYIAFEEFTDSVHNDFYSYTEEELKAFRRMK